MPVASLAITVLWLIFIIFWIVSAFKAKKNIRTGNWRYGALIRLVFIIALILYAQSPKFELFYYGHKYFIAPNPAGNIIGVLLCALGIALAVWARVFLGSNWGMPMSVKENPELVTSGPYRFVRHPIYTGVLVAMLGTALVTGLLWLVIFVVSGIYFIFSATREEKIMAREFPNQYPQYKNKTKMLIPLVF